MTEKRNRVPQEALGAIPVSAAKEHKPSSGTFTDEEQKAFSSEVARKHEAHLRAQARSDNEGLQRVLKRLKSLHQKS